MANMVDVKYKPVEQEQNKNKQRVGFFFTAQLPEFPKPSLNYYREQRRINNFQLIPKGLHKQFLSKRICQR